MLSTIGKGEENYVKHLAQATGCQGGLHPSAALSPKSFFRGGFGIAVT